MKKFNAKKLSRSEVLQHPSEKGPLMPKPFPGRWPTRFAFTVEPKAVFKPQHLVSQAYIGKLNPRTFRVLNTALENHRYHLDVVLVEFDRANVVEKEVWVRGQRIPRIYNLNLLTAYHPLDSSVRLYERMLNYIYALEKQSGPFLKRLKGWPIPYYSLRARLNPISISEIKTIILKQGYKFNV